MTITALQIKTGRYIPKHGKGKNGLQTQVPTVRYTDDSKYVQQVEDLYSTMSANAQAEIRIKAAQKSQAQKRFGEAEERINQIHTQANQVLKKSKLSGNIINRTIWEKAKKLYPSFHQAVDEAFNNNFIPVLYPDAKPKQIYKLEHNDEGQVVGISIYSYDKKGDVTEHIYQTLNEPDVLDCIKKDGDKYKRMMFTCGELCLYSEGSDLNFVNSNQRTVTFDSVSGDIQSYSEITDDSEVEGGKKEEVFVYDENLQLVEYTRTNIPAIPFPIGDNIDCQLKFFNGGLSEAQYRTRKEPDKIGEYYINLDDNGCEYCTDISNKGFKNIQNPYLSMFDAGASIGEVISFNRKDGKLVPEKYMKGITNNSQNSKPKFEYQYISGQ